MRDLTKDDIGKFAIICFKLHGGYHLTFGEIYYGKDAIRDRKIFFFLNNQGVYGYHPTKDKMKGYKCSYGLGDGTLFSMYKEFVEYIFILENFEYEKSYT